MHRITTLFLLLLISAHSYSEGGYIGFGQSINSSVNYDTQNNGLRIDLGAIANEALDLEWSFIDFGVSDYNDPAIIPADLTDTDTSNDLDYYDNSGFGKSSRSAGSYIGISETQTYGISAGLKFKKPVNNWLKLFAKASFLAWQSNPTRLELYLPRAPLNAQGDPFVDDPNDDTDTPANLNPCGSNDFCRIEDDKNAKTFWAVDFWYGYGVIIQPLTWLALKAEYSVTTLNAFDFPKSKIEGFTTSLEIHY